MRRQRIVAIVAAYNERRFIAPLIEHYVEQGVEIYLIDNESTDATVAIAEPYLGRGLIGIESFPRNGIKPWQQILERKEELALTLDADWLLHCDADEFRISPRPGERLADALARADEEGCNAVNFLELTFIPTRENPDHDHALFRQSLRTYYPFLPWFPHRVTAWKKQPQRVELAWSGGHMVRFPDLRLSPHSLLMRHYVALSAGHVVEKYVNVRLDEAETARGWHGWRACVDPSRITFPPAADLRIDRPDAPLDTNDPWKVHYAARWKVSG